MVKFYEAAEAILSHLSQRGLPMILREVEHVKAKTYSFSGMQKIVQRMEARMLSATRRCYAHRLANQTATTVQNEPVDAIQNENAGKARSF